MVLAVANTQDTTRKDLKSLPGGFVVIRRLTWGEKIQRRAMVSGMKIKGGQKGNDFEGEMNMVNEAAMFFDFQRCVVEHNLEKPVLGEPKEDGTQPSVPLDFQNKNDIKMLDPKVGEEIDGLLSELNNFEEDDGEGEG